MVDFGKGKQGFCEVSDQGEQGVESFKGIQPSIL